MGRTATGHRKDEHESEAKERRTKCHRNVCFKLSQAERKRRTLTLDANPCFRSGFAARIGEMEVSSLSKAGLAADFDALYERTRERIGEADLRHIRHVAQYSRAIEARGVELIRDATSIEALRRGVLLRALHVVVEFSELGHNILHGSYDDLEEVSEFRSDRWVWDFVVDPEQWKRMHHQNHHPMTNVVGQDHDLGYTIARLFSNQSWLAHHLVQGLIPFLFLAPMPLFGIYTATSSARVEGKDAFDRESILRSLAIIQKWAWREYISLPLSGGAKAPVVAAANHVSQVLGYSMVAFMLVIEHHAPNVAVFANPGPYEDRDAYYERQVRGTTNFTGAEKILEPLKELLEAEVPFENRPEMAIFMGGLDTHLEHHLFPDLPCNRQREITRNVQAICEKHGIPYNQTEITGGILSTLRQLLPLSAPVAPGERLRDLLRSPKRTIERLREGFRYANSESDEYLRAPRFFNAKSEVLDKRMLAGGQAVWLRLARPPGWEELEWKPGAFISVGARVNGENLVRQYSLLRESAEGGPIEITIRRVPNGKMSGHLCDSLNVGEKLTLVHAPTRAHGLVQEEDPARAIYIAGGVGITPILSMLRRHVRKRHAGHQASLFYFNRSRTSALFLQELQDLALRSELELHLFFGDEDAPRMSAELLKESTVGGGDTTVFCCAPEGLLRASREACASLGIEADRFFEEAFGAPAQSTEERRGITHAVRFARSGRTLEVDEGETLLGAAERAGIALPSGCKRGMCRACACPLVSGEIQVGAQSSRTSGDSQGRVTLCNSFPRSALVVDA